MKREIKFRGKNQQGKWIIGEILSLSNHKYIAPEDGDWLDFIPWVKNNVFHAPDSDKYEVEQDTIGQFTGLHDKNGKEIYEGDILRGDCYPYNYSSDGVDNYLGVVFFADDDYTWEVMKFATSQSKISGISDFINDEFADIDFSQMEVIGNLWDNKGLFRDSDEEIMKWFNG